MRRPNAQSRFRAEVLTLLLALFGLGLIWAASEAGLLTRFGELILAPLHPATPRTP